MLFTHAHANCYPYDCLCQLGAALCLVLSALGIKQVEVASLRQQNHDDMIYHHHIINEHGG